MTKRRIRANEKQAYAEAQAWNLSHPTGTLVRYWTGIREGEGRIGRTRSAASVICWQPVVWIFGVTGCVALSHVEPLEEDLSVAAIA